MMHRFARRLARCLAVLAVAFQAMVPGMMAYADVQGLDVSRYFCGSSDTLSAGERATVDDIARLLGETPRGQKSGSGGHCPLCTLSHAVLAAPPVAVPLPCERRFQRAVIGHAGDPHHDTPGPPVGPRGPPLHV